MVWTHTFKFKNDETIITIFKNNRLFFSGGFGHLVKNKAERLKQISCWVYDYAKILIADAEGNSEEILEINVIISEILQNIIKNYPEI